MNRIAQNHEIGNDTFWHLKCSKDWQLLSEVYMLRRVLPFHLINRVFKTRRVFFFLFLVLFLCLVVINVVYVGSVQRKIKGNCHVQIVKTIKVFKRLTMVNHVVRALLILKFLTWFLTWDSRIRCLKPHAWETKLEMTRIHEQNWAKSWNRKWHFLTPKMFKGLTIVVWSIHVT